MANAFEQAEFLRSEKDTRPYWETDHRALALPLIKSGYNDSVRYGVPGLLGGASWGVLDDILRGRDVAKGEVESAAGEAAGAAMTGAFAAPRPKGSIGMAGREQPAAPARELDPLGFYSQALETAKTLQPKAPIEQYLAALRNKGVKQAELDATGVANAFEPQRAISRDDLVNHLRENRVGMKEAKYTTVTPKMRDDWARQLGADDYASLPPDMQRQTDATLIGASRHGNDLRGIDPPAKWQRHSLDETNPTYAERVLHMAESPRARAIETRMIENQRVISDLREQAKDLRASPDFGPLHAARKENAALLAELKQINANRFRSGHFPEPNIVGHTQSSIVELPDGRKAQAFDQVQSDWGQRIESDTREALARQLFGKAFKQLSADERKAVSAQKSTGDKPAGVRDEAKIAELEARDAAAQELWQALNRPLEGTGVSVSDLERFVSAGLDKFFTEGGQTPNARGKNTLDAFQAFGGRDAVAKAVQARQSADLVRAELRTAKAAAPGHPLVNTTDQWLNTLLRRSVRNAVDSGVDAIAIPSGDTVLQYNPGGEHGMNAFYNDIVPKNLAAILGKLDKAGLRRQIIDHVLTPGDPNAGRGFTIFDLTPKMREEVLKGLPLFSRGVPVTMPTAPPAPYDPSIY